MRLPRVRLRLWTLLLLPAAVALLLVAIDPLTERPSFWRIALFEFDVVDASNKRPIQALVTLTYLGPLAGQPDSGISFTTAGVPYDTYRGITPDVGHGGLVGIVRHRQGTRFLRRHDMTVTEGVRFRVEAAGYETYEFDPVDTRGSPLEFKTWDPPVFRVELRPIGRSDVLRSWSTRPELRPWGAEYQSPG